MDVAPRDMSSCPYGAVSPYLPGVLSSLLLLLSFPNANLSFLVWIALIPLLAVSVTLSVRDVAISAALAGFIFFLFGFHWIRYFTLLGWLVLASYHSIYFMVFALGTRLIWDCRPMLMPIGASALWVTLEFLRSFLLSGFPWLYLSHTQYRNNWIIQISEFTGAYGVSFSIVAVNTVLFLALWTIFSRPPTPGRRFRRASTAVRQLMPGVIAVCAALAVAWAGNWRLKRIEKSSGPMVAVLQGNIPQDIKIGQDEEYERQTLDSYVSLTEKSMELKPDLIIWPETMVPSVLNLDREMQYLLKGLAVSARAPLLVGAVTLEIAAEEPAKPGTPGSQVMSQRKDEDICKYNSAYLIDSDASSPLLGHRYDKIHLVPFGEYLPFRKWLPFMGSLVPYGRDYTPGKRIVSMAVGQHTFRVLICFEDIFPALVRQMCKDGVRPDFLVNMSNDGWFRKSSELREHLAASVFRAVENRIGIVRATNTGISGFVLPGGEVNALQNADGESREIRGLKVQSATICRENTFYTLHGDVFAIGCLLLTLLFASVALPHRKKVIRSNR